MTEPGVRAARASAVSAAVASLGLVVVVVVATGVLLVAVGAFLPIDLRLAFLSSVVVPDQGPALVLLGLCAAAVAVPVRRRFRRLGTAALGLGLAASALLAVVVGGVVATVAEHGGSVNLWQAALPSPVPSAVVDERSVFSVGPGGNPLHLSWERPRLAPVVNSPVMVYVHGGGWVGGSDLSRAADIRAFAERGWLAVSVEYTLARPGRPTWDIAGPEVACAVSRIATQAPALGGDPSRIVLAGDSAGGQLAVSVAYHAATRTQRSSCGGVVPVPRAVAVNYPAVDLVAGYEHGARSSRRDLDARYLASTYTGGTPAEVPDRYRAVSGVAALTPTAPPTLVIGPARDTLVPPASLSRFTDAARRVGVDATLVSIPFVNHAYDGFGDGSLGQQAGLSILESWARAHVLPGSGGQGLPGGS